LVASLSQSAKPLLHAANVHLPPLHPTPPAFFTVALQSLVHPPHWETVDAVLVSQPVFSVEQWS
jgi:hypothetical protein